MLERYNNIARSDVRAANKDETIARLRNLQAMDPGLFVQIVRALINFKMNRKHTASPRVRQARRRQQIALLEDLEMQYARAEIRARETNTIIPSIDDLLILVKNSGTFVQRTLPSTFKDFLNGLSDIYKNHICGGDDEIQRFLVQAGVAFQRSDDQNPSEAFRLTRAWFDVPANRQLFSNYPDQALGEDVLWKMDSAFIAQVVKDFKRQIRSDHPLFMTYVDALNEAFECFEGEHLESQRGPFYEYVKDYRAVPQKPASVKRPMSLKLPFGNRFSAEPPSRASVVMRTYFASKKTVAYFLGINQGTMCHHAMPMSVFNVECLPKTPSLQWSGNTLTMHSIEMIAPDAFVRKVSYVSGPVRL